DTLVALAAHDHPSIRAAAGRAIGRLEDPALVPRIAGAQRDDEAEVRAAPGGALAQAVPGPGGEPALGPHTASGANETGPAVRGALAQALGRLVLPDADAVEVIRILLGWTESVSEPVVALGAARGMETAMRTPGPAASDPALIG